MTIFCHYGLKYFRSPEFGVLSHP